MSGSETKRIPQRKCVGCGVSKNKGDLIRVVRGPENPETKISEISVDLKGRKPGRGAYICRDEGCLKKAVKSGRFNRNLGVKVCGDILDSLLGQIKGGETE
ncbi:MAG: YlxR family protein [Oscillospiraceae bacterium]|nr:YlxR family protein [Oscillospiraceae bacterium]